jgi:hypothetical protein
MGVYGHTHTTQSRSPRKASGKRLEDMAPIAVTVWAVTIIHLTRPSAISSTTPALFDGIITIATPLLIITFTVEPSIILICRSKIDSRDSHEKPTFLPKEAREQKISGTSPDSHTECAVRTRAWMVGRGGEIHHRQGRTRDEHTQQQAASDHWTLSARYDVAGRKKERPHAPLTPEYGVGYTSPK